MQTDSLPPPCGVERSLTGRRWRWRSRAIELAGENGPAGGAPLDDLVTQLLMARGVRREDLQRHLTPTLRKFLPDPSIFRDADAAAERLAQAVLEGERVTIYGDYDVDGATSAALLIRLLSMLGVKADHYIPDRLLEGYGPSGEALLRLGKAGSSLIVTVDCGAMAFEALAMANDAGIDVIVIDHHKCAAELPRAVALVNPNRLDQCDEGAAHGHMAAVGVAFLVAVALVRLLRQRGFFAARAEPDLLSLLDLVALGTVADMAALTGINRAFVRQGLKVMAARANIGLAALIDASGLTRAPICSDLGFALGPRINAGGRVGEATLGVRLLTTADPGEAAAIADQLSALNEDRRAIEREVLAEAQEQLAGQQNRSMLVAAGSGWHPGVIGIVAGRLKEQFGKPVFVIALDPESGKGKGSGRSISGVDIGAAVIAAREAGILSAGGGHPMAAGLTVPPGGIDPFRDWMEECLARQVKRASASRDLVLDLAVAPGGIAPELVAALEGGGPYGIGWPAPRIAAGTVRVIKADIVGSDHVRVIAVGQDGQRVKAIAFRAAASELGQGLLHAGADRALWLAGQVKTDDWGAQARAELHIEDAAFA
jgi:single-stranded-DNA-specific exonuclease